MRALSPVRTGLPVLLLVGCIEQRFDGSSIRELAVVTGDFDDLSAPLNRLAVPHDLFHGITSVATWDPDYPTEPVGPRFEDLVGTDVLFRYDAVLIGSGARGLGSVVYNGVAPDDHVVTDPAVVDNVRLFARRGGHLLVTDWAYDLVEAGWPDRLDFVGDDAQLDAAQTGLVQQVQARVVDARLAEALGGETLAVQYDFSNWAPVQGVADGVTVWLRGHLDYRLPGTDEIRTLTDAPLLVSFVPPGSASRVIYSTLHLSRQPEPVADALVRTLLGPLPEGREPDDAP